MREECLVTRDYVLTTCAVGKACRNMSGVKAFKSYDGIAKCAGNNVKIRYVYILYNQ